jgi:hypothetical protein
MAALSQAVNELRKITVFKDNSVEVTLNLGEIPTDQIRALYDIKKNGDSRLLYGNVEDWIDAVRQEGENVLA